MPAALFTEAAGFSNPADFDRPNAFFQATQPVISPFHINIQTKLYEARIINRVIIDNVLRYCPGGRYKYERKREKSGNIQFPKGY